jgi:murein L,D-transpeptidase YcbB/YkuD
VAQRNVKIRTLAAAALALAAAAPARAQQQDAPADVPASELRIDLNIPENRLRLWDGDSLVKSYPVSVGKPGHDTPDGRYVIDHAEWNPWWRPPPRDWARDDKVTPPGPSNPMGRVKLFFAPLYYIHGTPDADNIGQPASHGCVRMLNRDVVELAKTLHARNGGTVRGAAIDRLLARSSATTPSRLAVPVPLTIRYDPIVVQGGELSIYPDVYELRRVHTEAVIQALLSAGYDAGSIDRAAIRGLLRRAEDASGVFTVQLADAFAGLRRAPAPAAR